MENLGYSEAKALQHAVHNLRNRLRMEPLDYVIENQFVKASP